MIKLTDTQKAIIAEIEKKLNEGHDSGYENYSVWQCWDGTTDVRYSNIDTSKRYVFDTDNIDTVVNLVKTNNAESYCVSSHHYEMD